MAKLKDKPEIKGETKQPLQWPEGQPRTRLTDRKPQASWKIPYSKTVELLTGELRKLKVTAFLITHNQHGSPDNGVAVYFSLKPDDSESWQEALGFIGEVPTLDQISKAYQERARRVHPEGPTPDPDLFHALTKHRDRAKAWAKGEQTVEHEKVIAVDTFNEVRLNLNAIRITLSALRQIERCGSPMQIERAFMGFSKRLAANVGPGQP